MEGTQMTIGRTTMASLLAATTIAALAIGQQAYAKEQVKYVNCAKPNASIQEVVDKANKGDPIIIFVEGQCAENVLIEADDVTLSGNGSGLDTIGAWITGTITIRGAQRVRVEYLHVTGPGAGVVVTDGAAATIAHNELVDNVSDGVTVASFSFARVEFNTITGNGRPAPVFEAGIDVYVNGTVRSRGNFIADNNYAAVEVGNMSYFRSGVNTDGEPPGPEDGDIILQKGCAQGDMAGTCGASGTNAVECYRNGVCDIRVSDITGFITLSGLSNFDVRNEVTINGNIQAFGGSLVHIRGGVRGSGFVNCIADSISSGAIPCFGMIPPAP